MQLVLALSTVFVAMALVVWAAASWILQSADQRRVRQVLDAAGPAAPRPDAKRRTGFLARSKKEAAASRGQLARAGFRHPSAASIFSAIEKLSVVVFGLPGLLLLHGPTAWFFAGIGGMLGYLVPGVVLSALVERRRRDIGRGLPDALDLLVLCLEAGVSLNQAIVRTTDELKLAYPALAEELQLVTTEIRAGKPRLEALKTFEKRTKLESVRALVLVLGQTERFGTSASQALKTLAADGRSKRRQAAEERAGKLGVKIVFPLVLCLFPALYVVLLGPAAIRFTHYFAR